MVTIFDKKLYVYMYIYYRDVLHMTLHSLVINQAIAILYDTKNQW